MARKPEAVFRSGVNKKLPPAVYHCGIGGSYVGGIPDEYYEGPAGILFAEYKRLPPRHPPVIDLCDPSAKTKLSALQQEWLRRAHGNGVKVAVICGSGDGKTGVVFEGTAWEEPIDREAFAVQAIDKASLAQWITEEVT